VIIQTISHIATHDRLAIAGNGVDHCWQICQHFATTGPVVEGGVGYCQ